MREHYGTPRVPPRVYAVLWKKCEHSRIFKEPPFDWAAAKSPGARTAKGQQIGCSFVALKALFIVKNLIFCCIPRGYGMKQAVGIFLCNVLPELAIHLVHRETSISLYYEW